MEKYFLLFILTIAVSNAAYSKSEVEASDSIDFRVKNIGAFTGLKTDIPIGEVDGVMLRINIALPSNESAEPRPALVLIHGGGLIKGDKSKFNKRIEAMAERGVVAASVMYRFAPKYRFPAPVEDVKAAIRFLKAHAKTFNLDTDRIIVSGVSSGGYLATMVGVTGNAGGFSDHEIYPDFDSSVRAVISQSAHIADFTRVKYRDFAVVKRFIDTDNPDRQAALAAISPITYLDKNDPPFFLAHGTADERVPVAMSREFALELKAIGHVFEYIEVEGGKHSLKKSRPKEASEVFSASLDFFRKYAFPEKI
ncbi:alpha/beta hydrolase [Exilibacterium tricleocarpae]|uniref:Alpha/beta hydrolase n=1 Tax=Exilibacterium tricleocarpae TaxID=2591008 RepID=A0A545TV96_9GAMM|nr:alpha/beta hydrolase [Exilibacterium tricleocarpae]TQV81138.1 alpha/beta hydrolase [Exilibacterium tricleocarpae]